MENIVYKAFVVKEIGGEFVQSVQMLETKDLPQNDVLINVRYSSLNYKDALSSTGNKGVTRNYPHTPGIDSAGIVVESNNDEFKVGDEVIVTGNDLGMNTPGGFGQYISVPASWVVKLPVGLTMKEAMIIGTAGFTTGICLTRLTELVKPEDGKILVSGATGGVGSVSVSLLKKIGYQTVAVSGKETEYDFLRNIGADEIISREVFQQVDKKPILSAQYAGAIDTVGGTILENILKQLKPLGAVTICGNVVGAGINTTVLPFILRGISLIGVSSQNYPLHLRKALWLKLANEWKPDTLLDLYNEISIYEISNAVENILKGKLKGRTIIDLNL